MTLEQDRKRWAKDFHQRQKDRGLVKVGFYIPNNEDNKTRARRYCAKLVKDFEK